MEGGRGSEEDHFPTFLFSFFSFYINGLKRPEMQRNFFHLGDPPWLDLVIGDPPWLDLVIAQQGKNHFFPKNTLEVLKRPEKG